MLVSVKKSAKALNEQPSIGTASTAGRSAAATESIAD